MCIMMESCCCGGGSKWKRSARDRKKTYHLYHLRIRQRLATTAVHCIMLMISLIVLSLPSPLVDAFSLAPPPTPSPSHQKRRRYDGMTVLKAQSTKELERATTITTRRREYSMFDSRNTESMLTYAMDRPDRTTEMMGSALAFSTFIVYGLAMSDKVLMRGLEREGLEETADNILNVVLPMSSADVVSVAFGEAFAGIFSAVAWFIISSTFNNMKQRMDEKTTSGAGQSSSSSLSSSATGVNAIADGDFFVTKAALYPVFESLGLSPVAAGIASVLVSLIPSEIVKFASRRRQQEDLQLELLLQQQQLQKQQQGNVNQPLGFLTKMVAVAAPITKRDGPSSPERGIKTTTTSSTELMSLVPVLQQKEESFFVETFADMIKWLEYTVLNKQYGGELGLYPVVEGVIFGILCAVSSQMYTDLLYIGFGIQGEAKRKQLLSRTATEWSAVYLYRCISVSTLFGVYQLVQFPVQMFIAALLTGSLDSCYGSDDFILCQETFEYFNPIDRASIVTEVRALAVQLLALWDRIATILNI